jgi:hypothetical protein
VTCTTADKELLFSLGLHLTAAATSDISNCNQHQQLSADKYPIAYLHTNIAAYMLHCSNETSTSIATPHAPSAPTFVAQQLHTCSFTAALPLA